MVIKSIIGATCACLTVVSFSTEAALVSRLGGLAYYDTEADLTWLADANYAQTSGYDDDGRMTWVDANAWAAQLDINGVTGWRLPNTIDVGNDGATQTNLYQAEDYGYNLLNHSEMSNMYYNVLGNLAQYDTSGVETGCTGPDLCLTNTGPFSNLQSWIYWSSLEYVVDTNYAWSFQTNIGVQNAVQKTNDVVLAWAVQSGDVSAVPVPAAAWLFGSGLLGLIGVARRKKA